MSFLKKIFGKEESEDTGPRPECTHGSMVAHWDRPEDMGNEELASSWRCTSCGDEFSSDDRRLILAAEAERVHHYQEEKAELEAQAAAGTRVV
jgi:hypothetical protein